MNDTPKPISFGQMHRGTGGAGGNRPAPAPYGHAAAGSGFGHNRYPQGNLHAATPAATYGTAPQAHDSSVRRVRNADDLTDDELNTRWYTTLDNTEQEGIDQSFSLFGDINPDGLNFYDLRLALKALGFDLSNADVKSWIEKFGQTPNDWRPPAENPQAPCPTVQLRLPQETYQHVAACLVAFRPPRELWTKAFAVFDRDNKGVITAEDLRRASNQLGKELSDGEIQRMIQEADIDGRGGVNLEEFIVIMERSSARRQTSYS